jgi:hypothetical protein
MGKLGKIIKTILLVGVIGTLLFVVGTCAWQNCRKPDTGPATPSAEKATYSVTIKATGRVIFTGDITTTGVAAGERLYTLKGYWEVTKDKYVYHGVILSLDEKVFGEIEVKKR